MTNACRRTSSGRARRGLLRPLDQCSGGLGRGQLSRLRGGRCNLTESLEGRFVGDIRAVRQETIVQSPLAAAALIGFGMACAAEREPRVPTRELDAPSAAQIVPIGLDRPPALAEGETCEGVASRVIPNAESGVDPYWGCFEAGAIDRAFTPGVSTPPPILFPIPSWEVQFDASELEGLKEDDGASAEELAPEVEIEQN